MSEIFHLEQRISIAIVTVSDTRSLQTDESGQLIRKLAQEKGLVIAAYEIVKDDAEEIRKTVSRLLELERVDAVITTGGTGIAKRDVTYEAVTPLFEKELPGFGELFRFLSYTEDIGSKALLSRAAAGTSVHKALFVLPGSRGAVRLAMEKLILPEIRHIVFELTKHLQARE
ncbi:molybdenum cofactor biosynthesis protein B [Planomicrobium koreense]|uniref:Molybdenum cofactor biosynthesis protein B n=1 Tax=Planococcus koreensis TaxID=112331 RepID=A0A7W8CWD2_9BACL|nr:MULTISPECIES: molybdenum cofactor biosynthesis protein B [Planococcus]MBB5181220.1 molybdenum cofactor biosynthesis protein B [Planococcus koreensis]MDN3451280.1 molybdenum cofactor biosynthesis protein B [Planococcus sp. APC 3906]